MLRPLNGFGLIDDLICRKNWARLPIIFLIRKIRLYLA